MQLRHLKLEVFLIFSYRPWIQTNLVLSSIEKVKPGQIWFSTQEKKKNLVFSLIFVTWIEQEKILILQLSPPKLRYFADQNGSEGDPMKINFENFQIQKWVSQTAEKVDEKNEVICFFPSWVMVLQLPKIVQCLQVCADLISRSIKAVYLCPCERPYHALLENNMFYRGLSNSSQDIEE